MVARPSDTEEFCIEAYLETGHIGKVPRTEAREIAGSEIHASWSDSYNAKPKGDDDETTVYDQADRFWRVQDFYPGQGYTIKDAVLSKSPAKCTRDLPITPWVPTDGRKSPTLSPWTSPW
ncbi:MAG: hypothetical protein DI613_12365 [Kocuria rhizophila]|nr:MAG: hypothetical protein DI613_12365 [Kocuria rhizophila]